MNEKRGSRPSSVGAIGRPPAGLAALDDSVLKQVRDDYGDEDGAILAELIAAFVDAADTFECAAALPDNIAQATLGQRAQQLRGTAVMVGARNVAALCYQLEAVDRAGHTQAVAQLMTSLSLAIAQAKHALKRMLPRTP
jgi:hypothetical protein